MRLFIAVPVPVPAREAVSSLVARLSSAGADLKWTDPRLLHLTLSFLGETPKERLPEIEESLAAAAGRPPFPLALGGVGLFGPPKRPRVLWLGLREGGEALGEAAAALRSALAERGLPREEERARPFSAHLTLGRFRSARGLESLRPLLAEAEGFSAPPFRAESLVLYESRLSPEGPAHLAVAERAFR